MTTEVPKNHRRIIVDVLTSRIDCCWKDTNIPFNQQMWAVML